MERYCQSLLYIAIGIAFLTDCFPKYGLLLSLLLIVYIVPAIIYILRNKK